MNAGWMRVGVAIVLLVVVVAALGVWYKQRASDGVGGDPTAAPSSSSETSRKPASLPRSDSRDAPRERPERERTDRPGNGRPSTR
jgi:cytoskeletal protein RodZ